MDRLAELVRFYSILDRLEHIIGGARCLATCSGRMNWPKRGVYFFREPGESRKASGDGLRVVRVGTHALKASESTTLWTRLSQHRGQSGTGGGNHRGSIFRLLVGGALIKRRGYSCATWGDGSTANVDVRSKETELEREVSNLIGAMPFVWLSVDDDPGPESVRGYIERNSIALLSNYSKPSLDAPSPTWLGSDADRERVRRSGLWNQNHVDEMYDPRFLERFDQ